MGADISAHDVEQLVVEGDDAAFLVGADADPMPLLSRVIGRFEMLIAILDPGYWSAQSHCDERDQKILGVELTADAVSASVLELDHANAAGWHVEQTGEHGMIEMDDLGGSPDGQQALTRIVFGDQAARFQRHAGMTLDVEFLLEHQLGLRERAVYVACLLYEVPGDVVGHGRMQNRGTLFDRMPRINQAFQRLDICFHEFERILGLVARFGNDHRDWFADIADAIARERFLQGTDQVVAWCEPHRNRLHVGHVGEGEYRDYSRSFSSAFYIDMPELAVGDLTAKDRRMQHARAFDIGHEAPAAAQQPIVFLARYAFADIVHEAVALSLLAILSAASSTALTMFWYPVQRHRFPLRPSRTSSSLGFGLSASIASTVISMPGVQ